MQFRAKLDTAGIYLGVEGVEELQSGDIEVPEHCDLTAGAYRWVTEHAQFVPLPKMRVRPAPDVPSTEEALYALISVMESKPAACIAWARAFENSLGRV